MCYLFINYKQRIVNYGQANHHENFCERSARGFIL